MVLLCKRLGFWVNQNVKVNDWKAYEKLKQFTKDFEDWWREKSEWKEKEKQKLKNLL